MREKATSLIENRRRRLDIVVDLKFFGIGIENKPWAGEQPAQIGDYVANLERRFAGNYKIIYLSAGGGEPTSIARCEIGLMIHKVNHSRELASLQAGCSS
jgi:hypothetical protein